jgi:hypothetical protein
MAAQKPPDRRASAPTGERRSRQASDAPRYPDVHVTLRSTNPYAVVSAVRHALRRSRVDQSEVARFSDEAFETEEPQRMRAVCDSWADVELKV